MKLGRQYYRNEDVVAVARDLLGKVLCSHVGGVTCRATITETEAYAGEGDRASHAFRGRRTARTEPMYAAGGCAYVYLCYGIHHLFNVVTHRADVPHAILVRAGQALQGQDEMLARRGRDRPGRGWLQGPGKLAEALGITTSLSGESLTGRRLWIEDRGIAVPDSDVSVGPRVGVDYAAEDARRPYRFVWRQDA